MNMKWISVKDGLPEEGEEVIFYEMRDIPYYYLGYQEGGKSWYSYTSSKAFPTHWMPLPEPPDYA